MMNAKQSLVKFYNMGGEVTDPNEEIASGFARGRESGRAEEAFRALVEGSQGFLGLEPGRRGSEAYRTGQALSNLPALALPAAAIKGTGKAKDALEALGKKEAGKVKTNVPPGAIIGPDGEPVVIYRGVVFAEDPTEGMMTGASRPGYATFGSTSPHVASSYANPELEIGERGAITPLFVIADQVVEFPVTVDRYGSRRFDKFEFDRRAKNLKEGQVLVARNVVDYGPRAKVELDPEKLYSYGSDIYAFGPETKTKPAIGKVLETKPQSNEVSTTDFIRKRKKGSPPEGEVPTDEYIQQMMTGTPPADRTTNQGLIPPEFRRVVDVPLDLANTFIRGAAGSIAGPVYGLYKGFTSDKFGTPEGVQEASTEAGKMMQKITGTPKTQTGRDVMEFIGGVAEEAKIPPMPQFLTTPAPGPGSARALMRSYETAETPPVGAINVPGTKAQVTPPKNEMGFFSPTEQVVMNLPQEKGTAQQMLAQISKAPGAKAAELRATGLEEFLKSKGTAPVTRQEIQDYLASNRVQVDEVVLGKGQTLSPEAKRLSDEAMFRMEEIDDKLAKYFEGVGEVAGQDPYSAFIMLRGPIGRRAAKGDQEALDELNAYNLPPEIKDLVLEFGRNKNEYVKYTSQARKMGKPKFDRYNIPGGTNAREIYLTLPNERKPSSLPSLLPPVLKFIVPDIHSVSPEADWNRVAHIFLDDRTDVEGNKVLFVQELQSDWAQQGRDKGFKEDILPTLQKALEEKVAQAKSLWNQNNNNPQLPLLDAEIADLRNQIQRISGERDSSLFPTQKSGAVERAPFVTNTEDWVNLALKRVIKDAVDNGYDKVAFIKGEQAAKKYGLSTVLDGIEVGPSQLKSSTFLSPNSPRLVELKQKSGGIIPLFVNQKGVVEAVDNDFYRQFIGKPLPEIVGKEMSEKIMTATLKPGGESSVNFDVKDMEIGGQGMKGFYDNILPKTANKLLAKLGSKIEPVDFGRTKSKETWVQGREHPFEVNQDASEPFEGRVTLVNRETGESRAFNTRDEANEYMAEALGHNKDQIHLGFKITPEMANMVKTQGLPQFAAGGEVTKFIKAHA